MSKIPELLDLLQEECAEVIQAISKCRRFGMDNVYKDGGTQRENLVQELGDVMAIIELLKENNLVTDPDLDLAKQKKFSKLRQWSKIYD